MCGCTNFFYSPWRSDVLFGAALRENLRNRAKMYEIILEMTMYGIIVTAVQLVYEIIIPDLLYAA